MAESKNNVVTHGLSGKVGKMLVFSQRHGKTIVSAPRRQGPEQSDKQKAQQQLFQQAVIYAKAALKNPETKAAYAAAAEEGQTAYNVAVADLFHAPDIEEIDLSAYTGKPGDIISIKATDDFKVTAVMVEIYNADGSVVEKGNAAVSETGLHWIYEATVDNPDLHGDKIVVKATDMPANVSEMEQVIP